MHVSSAYRMSHRSIVHNIYHVICNKQWQQIEISNRKKINWLTPLVVRPSGVALIGHPGAHRDRGSEHCSAAFSARLGTQVHWSWQSTLTLPTTTNRPQVRMQRVQGLNLCRLEDPTVHTDQTQLLGRQGRWEP